eukprot:1682236-Rhodomonas_salina.1
MPRTDAAHAARWAGVDSSNATATLEGYVGVEFSDPGMSNAPADARCTEAVCLDSNLTHPRAAVIR